MRRFFWLLLTLFFLPTLSGAAAESTFRNPLNTINGSDPWMFTFDGNYYLTTTTWTDIRIKKASTIAGLIEATPVKVWSDTDPSRCCNVWAPEFHRLSGPDGTRWYLYYVAGTYNNTDNQRIWVLESQRDDPMGPYTFKGQVSDGVGGWMIDPTVWQHDGQLYLIFSAFAGPNQSLWIAPMSDPWTVSGNRVPIASPTRDWETSLLNVNEGPEIIEHAGVTFLTFSASACWGPEYKLGLLTLKGHDPLKLGAWVKSPEPIFSSTNGVFGPGHNGFFKSLDGTEDWLVYHASDTAQVKCDGSRTTRIQKINWNADGTPDLGQPLGTALNIPSPSGE